MKSFRMLVQVSLCVCGLSLSSYAGYWEVSHITTITNPVPENNDYFGEKVHGIDNGQFLVTSYADDEGAEDAGSVAYYDSDYSLIQIITNPVPESSGQFGWGLSELDDEHFIVSAYKNNGNRGEVYIYSTNGTRVTTITNPAAGTYARFGYAVEKLDDERILIGASQQDGNKNDEGRAYLYQTDGTLLQTFMNPDRNNSDHFGFELHTINSNLIAIGEEDDNSKGSVHLYDTNATLLLTITNPIPGPYGFGSEITCLSSNTLLIGVPSDSSDGPLWHGRAFLYSLDGTLLHMYTNPAPADYGYYGHALERYSDDFFFIGFPGANDHQGAVYVMDTNGVMITSIESPDASGQEFFGLSLSMISSNRLVIGSEQEDLGAQNSGAAYIFEINYSTNNRAPIVCDTEIIAQAGHSYTGVVTAMDLDEDAFVFSKETDPSYGNATVETNGVFQYISTNGYFGRDTFTFLVSDDRGGEATGTVSVIVNAQPQPDNKIIFIDEDEVYHGTLSSEDAEQHVQHFDVLTVPSNGWVEICESGSFTYTPSANFSGNDSFTFLVTDALGGQGTGSVSITVLEWAPAISFYDGFESGVLSNYWSTYSDGEGRIQITTNFNPIDTWHITMDDELSNLDASLNELVLTIDLAGSDHLMLSFLHKTFYDDNHPMPDIFTNHYNSDGVAISVDGGTVWYKVQSLTSVDGTTLNYKEFQVDLDYTLQMHALNYVTNFMIKFQQYGDSPIQEDGFAFDDISIYENDPKSADLHVECSAFSETVSVSNLIVYTLTAWNEGLNSADNVSVISTLPEEVVYVSASQGGHYDTLSHSVHFSPGLLTKYETNTMGVIVKSTHIGYVTNVVSVYANTEDPVDSNNIVTSIVEVLETSPLETDIQLTVTASPDPVTVSNTLNYAVMVTNTGVTGISNLTCYMNFPPQLTFSAADVSGMVYDGLFVWQIADLEAGSNISYAITTRPVERGWVSTDFSVISEAQDGNVSNNMSSVSTYISFNLPWQRVRNGIVDNRYIVAYDGGLSSASASFGDMDGDNDLDIIFTYSGSNYQISFIENLGTPSFAVWASVQENDTYFTSDYGMNVCLADLHGDGDLDIFYGDYSGIHYRVNTGTMYEAQWAGPYNFSTTIASYPGHNRIELCDIDGDNDPDLFVKNSHGNLFVENTDSGWVKRTNAYNGLTDYVPRFYDIDNDGDFDMLYNTLLYENTGTVYQAAWAPAVSNETSISYWTIPDGDIDNDGDMDIVTGNEYGHIELRENIGTQDNVIWGDPIVHYVALDFGANAIPTTVDIDGDNDYDLFVGTGDGTLFFIKNEGDVLYPRWASPVTNSIFATTFVVPTFTDIDNDNDMDLFIGNNAGHVTFYENTGSVFQAAWSTPQYNYADAVVSDHSKPVFCDIDADNDVDMFLGDGYYFSRIYFYENIGTPYEAQWVLQTNTYGNLTNAVYSSFCFSDLDMDNDYDLIFSRYYDGKLEYVENIGAAQYAIWAPSVTNFGPITSSFFRGIHITDLDGDGDRDLLSGYSSGGLMLWMNQTRSIDITPAKKTLQSGESIAFSADLDSDAAYWRFIINNSGATINTNTGFYTAGAQPGLDIVEVYTIDGDYGRAFINVMEPHEELGDKAIIISGRTTPNVYDPVWLATDNMADYAYETFLYKGFSKSSIHYLSPVVNSDVDGNGVMDDIDAVNTYSNVSDTFQYFATNAVSNLYVYLVDHGETNSGGQMRLSPSESLSADVLSQWLDVLQNTYQMDVTVILDFCYAGTFLDDLVYTGATKRIVIASTTDEDPAFFIAQGLVSFSEAFFNALSLGFDIKTAFLLAQQAVGDYQDAWLDDNKDGVYNKHEDGNNATQTIGGNTVAGADIPEIGIIRNNQSLSGSTEATIWASDISATYPIDRVWCVVIPPNFNPDPTAPVVDLPECDLYNVGYRYEATYQGFSEPGTYKLIFYAMDALGNISLPKYGYVNQGGYDERVILVAGGATNESYSATIHEMANNAYQTFLMRQINASNIYYLSNHDIPEADDIVSSNALANAITNWADGSDKLTLYMIGNATNQVSGSLTNTLYELNATDYLDAPSIDGWLDLYQASTASCIVVMDFPSSGAWINDLTAPAGTERLLFSSTDEAEPCIWLEAGAWNSFSRIFLSYIYRGINLASAFSKSRTYTFNLSHAVQDPLMDDDGDNIPNEKGEGSVARYRYIGSSFVTADGALAIGSMTPDTLLLYTNSLLLWADDVVSEQTLSNVWVTITSPEYDVDTQLESVDLDWNESSERYEVTYTNFTLPGVYYCTFFAMDIDGTISSPLQAEVLKADAYEPDNIYQKASFFSLQEVQRHNFHQTGDEDWAWFYADSNDVYEVQTIQLGTNVDTVLEIYYQPGLGATPTQVYSRDDEAKGRGIGEYALMDHWTSGWYRVRVRPYDASVTGIGSEYELHIYSPEGETQLSIVCYNYYDSLTPVPGAVLTIDGHGEYPFNEQTQITETLPSLGDGIYTIRVTAAAGFIPMMDPTTNVVNMWNGGFANPRCIKVDGDGGTISDTFHMYPVCEVRGLVRDAWTHERVDEVSITFDNVNGIPPGYRAHFDGYPVYADYRTIWQTDDNGLFPTNVYLAPGDWSMTIHKNGYATSIWESVIIGASAGDVIDLGTRYLTPLDSQNNNGLADRWENIMFGGPVGFSPTDDSDGDGMSNWEEYLSGTNPNNGEDALLFSDNSQEVTEQGYTLRWPTVSGHCYRVMMSDSLVTAYWSLAAGPWTNTSATEMEWTDTNATINAHRYYRVEEMRP